jgi:eukaryotic-like serine/threonine-protein kinase
MDEPLVLWFQVRGETALGKVRLARQGLTRLALLSQQHGLTEFSVVVHGIHAGFESELGFPVDRRPIVDSLKLAGDRNTKAYLARTLALAGDAAQAQKLIGEVARDAPNDTFLNKVVLPTVQAILELQRGKPADAVAALDPARPYDLGAGPGGANYWPMYLRGAAYLKAHDGAKAQVEYQKILDHSGIDVVSPLLTLARLGAARAYAAEGDSAKARTAYQDFFAFWKDADPDIPLLKQAQAEYAKLQ